MIRLAGLMLVFGLLPACSTIAGVGKDVSALGRGISHVANEARDALFAPEPKPSPTVRVYAPRTYARDTGQPKRAVAPETSTETVIPGSVSDEPPLCAWQRKSRSERGGSSRAC